jgi:alcohol dehydrogenase
MSIPAVHTRAVVLTELGTQPPYAGGTALEVHRLDLKPPGPGELLIRVKAAGVCHSDLSVVNGSRPRPVPMVLGHEAAGIVEAVGSGVHDVEPGAHVVLVFVPSCGACEECVSGAPALCRVGAASNTAGELLRGGRRLHEAGEAVHHHLGVSAFSEYAIVDRSSAVVIDDDVPFETAALFGCMLLTGAGAVINTARVAPGDSVAVFGLGGVGLSAVMGASVAGAAPIIAIDPVEAKRSLALELGATVAFDPATATAQIRELLPQGVRYAFEAVGSEVVMEQAFDVTSRGGTTVAVGLPHPSKQFAVPAARIVAEARTVVGSYMGSARPQRDLPMLIELWRHGRLPVEKVRGEVFELEGVAAAFDALAEGEALRQIVIP